MLILYWALIGYFKYKLPVKELHRILRLIEPKLNKDLMNAVEGLVNRSRFNLKHPFMFARMYIEHPKPLLSSREEEELHEEEGAIARLIDVANKFGENIKLGRIDEPYPF
ncbi:MAG: hypothetical protein QW328_07200 [Nitrososphaerota archaeon]